MSDVLTVRETVRRAQQDGIFISEYTLRKWIQAGAIPIRRAGAKMLIFYPNLIRYLRCEDGGDNCPATVAAGKGATK